METVSTYLLIIFREMTDDIVSVTPQPLLSPRPYLLAVTGCPLQSTGLKMVSSLVFND